MINLKILQATYTWSASDKKVTTSYTITEKSLVDVEAKDEVVIIY